MAVAVTAVSTVVRTTDVAAVGMAEEETISQTIMLTATNVLACCNINMNS